MSYRQSPGGTGSSPQWMNNLNMSPNDQFGDSIILNGGSCPRPVTPRTPVSERAGSCARPGLRTPQASIIQRSFERSVYTPNGTFDSFDSQPPGASTPAGPNQNASNNSGSSCSYAGPNTHTMFGTTGSPPHGHRYIPPGPVSPFVLADYVDGPASGTSAGDSTGYYEPTYSGSGGQGVNNGTYQVFSSSNSERSGICTCNAGGGCGSPVQMNNSSGSNRSSPRSGGYAAPQQTFGGNSGGPSHFSQPSPASSAGSPNSPPSANQSGGPLRASTPARDQQNSNISGGVPSGDNSRSSPGSLPVSSPQNTNGTGSAGFQTPSNASAAQRPTTPSGGMFISNTTGSGLNDSAGFQTPSNASAAQRPPTPSGGMFSNTTGSGLNNSNNSRSPGANILPSPLPAVSMLAEPNDGTCGRGSKSPLAQPSTYRRRKRPPSCNNAVCVDGCTCERAQRGGPVELEGSNGQSCNAPPGQEPGGDAPVPIDPNATPSQIGSSGYSRYLPSLETSYLEDRRPGPMLSLSPAVLAIHNPAAVAACSPNRSEYSGTNPAANACSPNRSEYSGTNPAANACSPNRSEYSGSNPAANACSPNRSEYSGSNPAANACSPNRSEYSGSNPAANACSPNRSEYSGSNPAANACSPNRSDYSASNPGTNASWSFHPSEYPSPDAQNLFPPHASAGNTPFQFQQQGSAGNTPFQFQQGSAGNTPFPRQGAAGQTPFPFPAQRFPNRPGFPAQGTPGQVQFTPQRSPSPNLNQLFSPQRSPDQNGTCNISRGADLAFGDMNASGGEALGIAPLSNQPFNTQMDDIVRDGASFLMNVSGGSGPLNVPMSSPVAYAPDTSQIGNQTLNSLQWGSFEENILRQQNDSTASQEPMPPSPFFYQSPHPRNNNNNYNGGSPGGAAGGMVVPYDDLNTSTDSGYSARVCGPAPNPLVNAGNRMMGTSPGNPNRVFDTNKLKMWVLNAVGKACQGQCGKSPWECEEHILKFLMGVVTSWRNLYSRRNDGKFNFMSSNHFMNKNAIPSINDSCCTGESSFCSRR